MATEGRTRLSHRGLVAGIERSLELAGDPERLRARDPEVSDWSVGIHLEHLLLAESGILRWIDATLADPEGSPSGGRPSRRGTMVLVSGWIPRGRAKAPERTVPPAEIGEDLAERLTAHRTAAVGLEPRLTDIHGGTSTREHPILGHYTASQWLRFLDIHHRHHEKIIRDIG